MEIKITNPDYADLPQLYKMLWEAYEYHFKHSPPDFFKPFVENNPFYISSNFLIIKDKQKITASVHVFLLYTYFKKEIKKIGGIGQVATHPDYRGKGLAGKLLEYSIDYMKKHNVDYSLLFAGPVGLYNKFGWQELPVKFLKIKKKALYNFLTKSDSEYQVTEFKPEYRYFIYSIHENFIKNYCNCIIRNPVYWEKYVFGFKASSCKIYLLIKNKTPVAYVIFKPDNNILTLYEYCSIEPLNESYFFYLLDFLLKNIKFNEFYIPYGNFNYIPYKLFSNLRDAEKGKVTGFMVRDINSAINWENNAESILFFLSDSF